jgi:predicted DNA-binding transcriptional regulator AlpA
MYGPNPFTDTAEYDRRKLVRVVEIAKILGVSKQRADQLRREPDFPAPVDRWARGDLWAAADVRQWALTYAGGAAWWGPRS